MTIFELMDQYSNQYTKTERKIYENIKKFSDQYANKSLPELVEITGFSQAALTRFAQKLGFAGFSQFQYQYQQDLLSQNTNEEKKTRSQFYGEFLENTEHSIDKETLIEIAKHFMQCDHAFLAGANLSSLPAQYLDMSFRILKTCFSTCVDTKLGLQPVTSNDVYLLFSAYNGYEQRTVLQGFENAKEKPYRILVTLTNKHPLRKSFDEVIVLPESKAVNTNMTVMTETFAFMMFNDLLLHEIRKLQRQAQ